MLLQYLPAALPPFKDAEARSHCLVQHVHGKLVIAFFHLSLHSTFPSLLSYWLVQHVHGKLVTAFFQVSLHSVMPSLSVSVADWCFRAA